MHILFSLLLERVEMLQVREREREREGEGTSYLLHPNVDSIFRALLISFFYGMISAGGHRGGGETYLLPLSTHYLLPESAHFSWLTTCPVGVEIVCLYNFHNAFVFSFRFVIHFRCPFVYTGTHPPYKISLSIYLSRTRKKTIFIYIQIRDAPV